MALHPNIAGFDLATFRSLVEGPVDPRRAEAVIDDVARRLSTADVDEVRMVLVRVRQILDGRLRPGSVTDENSAVVNAVIALATTGQRPRWTDADVRPSSFVDFANRFPAAPSDLDGLASPGPRMRTLIRWALVERPMFGRQQSEWWSSYGYLSHDEVGRLLGYHRAHPSLGDHEATFATGFFRWLTEIHAAGLDYWFHTSCRASQRAQASSRIRIRYSRGVAPAAPG